MQLQSARMMFCSTPPYLTFLKCLYFPSTPLALFKWPSWGVLRDEMLSVPSPRQGFGNETPTAAYHHNDFVPPHHASHARYLSLSLCTTDLLMTFLRLLCWRFTIAGAAVSGEGVEGREKAEGDSGEGEGLVADLPEVERLRIEVTRAVVASLVYVKYEYMLCCCGGCRLCFCRRVGCVIIFNCVCPPATAHVSNNIRWLCCWLLLPQAL